MEDKENVPLVKKPKLSLSLKRNRFKKVSDEEILSAKKGFVPNNTLHCNKWALNNFKSWLASLSIGGKCQQL